MALDISIEIVILLRILAAAMLGACIGLERELTNKYAGLRTHILVCLGSCVFTVLSIYAFPLAVNSTDPPAFGDPARIAAQILTGIGFIGGGTVLRHGSSVSGLTTAATLWVTASIGMACGAGMVDIGFITTLVSVIVLVGIRYFERNVLTQSTKNLCKIRISTICDTNSADEIHKFILDKVSNVHEISKHPEKDGFIKINAVINSNGQKQIQALYKKFQNLKGIESISIQENDE